MPLTQELVKTGFERYRRYYTALTPLVQKTKPRMYTTTVFSFLAISLFGWYAIRPTVQTILYLQREIADKTLVNQKMEDKINSLITAQAAYQNVQDKLPLLEEALPKTPQAIEVASQLRNLSTQTGTTLSSLQITSVPIVAPDASTSAKTTQKPQVDFLIVSSISGSYEAVRTFLEGITDMRRILSVDSLTLTAGKEETASASAQQTVIQLVIKVKSYY
jgi:Tfp pilus assembly protein PilO